MKYLTLLEIVDVCEKYDIRTVDRYRVFYKEYNKKHDVKMYSNPDYKFKVPWYEVLKRDRRGFLGLADHIRLCKKANITTIAGYTDFCNKYNESSQLRLKSNPDIFFNVKWSVILKNERI